MKVYVNLPCFLGRRGKTVEADVTEEVLGLLDANIVVVVSGDYDDDDVDEIDDLSHLPPPPSSSAGGHAD